MKTAMQELIEKLKFRKENNCNKLSDVLFFDGILAIIEVENYLEKEKQQIINSHSKGQQWNKPGYNPDVSEQYYKETYEIL
jgi:hypothetical protein